MIIAIVVRSHVHARAINKRSCRNLLATTTAKLKRSMGKVKYVPCSIRASFKIPYYTIYDTKHPSGKAHGGTAVIVRNDIKHYLHSQVNKEYLQATTVTVQTSSNYFQLSAVYVPPRHKITSQVWDPTSSSAPIIRP